MKLITLSISEQQSKRIPKLYTYGFNTYKVGSLEALCSIANKASISGPSYNGGHRKGENIVGGSNIILIDCDEPGQAEVVEQKLQHYNYIKVPSASNLKYDYRWHFIILTQEPLSTYPAAFKWQVEQFFRQVGIDDSMIDTTGSYDISRQFAPASIGMTLEKANELSEVNNADLQVPISEPPDELCNISAKSLLVSIKGISTSSLPSEHLWFKGKAITYPDAIQAVREAFEKRENQDDKIIVSGFGCPHDNHKHEGDITQGYGFAFIGNDGDVIVKCSGNACKNSPYFPIPEPEPEVEIETLVAEHLGEPVNNAEFTERLANILLAYNPETVVSHKMREVFDAFCSTYNKITKDNSNNDADINRYIIPLATGSAKTTGAKLYLGISGTTGLLVVRKAMDAVQAVRDINSFAGEDITRTYYSIDAKNGRPDTAERVTKDELLNHRVIVLTHSMFTRLHHNSYAGIEDYSLYRNGEDSEPRETIIIDERIDLTRQEDFTDGELIDAIRIIKESDTEGLLSGHVQIMEDFNTLVFSHSSIRSGGSRFDGFTHSQLATIRENSQVFSRAIDILKSGRTTLTHQIRIRGIKTSEADRFRVEKSIIDLLYRIIFVVNSNMHLSREGKKTTISAVEDYSLKFGSVAILDATANVNKTYDAYLRYQPESTVMFTKPDFRNYGNASMYIAKGFKQSRSGLYSKSIKVNGKTQAALKTEAEKLELVQGYLSLLYSVMGENDNMLVVVHKDILPVFIEQCSMKNITFINWGNHAGSNQWNHYNKAAVIGWYRVGSFLYANQLNAAAKSYHNYIPIGNNYDADVKALSNSLVSDDIVQFLNRIRCRTPIDNEGNHKPVDFYLFSDDTTESRAIIDRVIAEFRNITVKEWRTAPSSIIKKKRTKMIERADNVLAVLKNEARTKADVMVQNIRRKLGINVSPFNRLLESEYFRKELEYFNIKITRLESVQGKPSMFDLSNIKNS